MQPQDAAGPHYPASVTAPTFQPRSPYGEVSCPDLLSLGQFLLPFLTLPAQPSLAPLPPGHPSSGTGHRLCSGHLSLTELVHRPLWDLLLPMPHSPGCLRLPAKADQRLSLLTKTLQDPPSPAGRRLRSSAAEKQGPNPSGPCMTTA